MCCGHDNQHRRGHDNLGSCACGVHANFGPCFWTKKERITHLEEIRDDLQNTIKSVEDRITALKEED